MTLPRSWYAFWTVAGASGPALSSATQARTSRWLIATKAKSPKRGSA
ncbi:MAG TPA: hypothetical protein VJ966_05130 [Actinomycetes bacterium]|nr:hypothetical protein [Actinomycetes bacterium]